MGIMATLHYKRKYVSFFLFFSFFFFLTMKGLFWCVFRTGVYLERDQSLIRVSFLTEKDFTSVLSGPAVSRF